MCEEEEETLKIGAWLPFLSPSSPSTIYVPSSLVNHSLTVYPFRINKLQGFYAIVPAGDAGTCLWPLSCEGYPKFLLDLTLYICSPLQPVRI